MLVNYLTQPNLIPEAFLLQETLTRRKACSKLLIFSPHFTQASYLETGRAEMEQTQTTNVFEFIIRFF